jgi:hypothetical protein
MEGFDEEAIQSLDPVSWPITVKWPLKDPRSAHPDNAEGLLYVYIYVYMFIYIWMYIYICMSIYVRICTCIFTYIYYC